MRAPFNSIFTKRKTTHNINAMPSTSGFIPVSILLILFYSTLTLAGTPYQENGDPHCPCINPWTLSNSHLLCNTKQFTGDCYDSNFGSNACKTFDVIYNTTGCEGKGKIVDGVEEDKEWCANRWCYIDPDNCWKPHSRSSYFNNDDSIPDNVMHYSYETCENMNIYDE